MELETRNYIGIDLGTSSVKILKRYADGSTEKVREIYRGEPPESWWEAVCRGLIRIGLADTAGIGMAAQVGTYLVDGAWVVGWNLPAGSEEIDEVTALCDGPEWDREIGMRHPRLISYPLPRLCYIKKHWPGAREVCQPKDWLLRRLTGEFVTDPYSWRGLSRMPEGGLSEELLRRAGVEDFLLPPVAAPTARAGVTRPLSLPEGEIPGGIPVYVGLNDFFSSLLGMGMRESELFDITGTSEHIGIIEPRYHPDEELVSGPWLSGYAHYGVTASSGESIRLSGRLCEAPLHCPDLTAAAHLLDEMTEKKPPVFLPYVSGERAPIWDADARGAYFGISADCGGQELSYAALEGVCFSLLHVYETLGRPAGTALKLSGGASSLPLMNLLKAELLRVPVTSLEESETTALGAVMLAMIGDGVYADYTQAIEGECRAEGTVLPRGRWQEWLMDRYRVYRMLYPALKPAMREWRDIK